MVKCKIFLSGPAFCWTGQICTDDELSSWPLAHMVPIFHSQAGEQPFLLDSSVVCLAAKRLLTGPSSMAGQKLNMVIVA